MDRYNLVTILRDPVEAQWQLLAERWQEYDLAQDALIRRLEVHRENQRQLNEAWQQLREYEERLVETLLRGQVEEQRKQNEAWREVFEQKSKTSQLMGEAREYHRRAREVLQKVRRAEEKMGKESEEQRMKEEGSSSGTGDESSASDGKEN